MFLITRLVHFSTIALLLLSIPNPLVGQSDIEGEKDFEFERLFNGTDLTGWYAMETYNPREFAAQTEAVRNAAIEKAKSETGKFWRVENGEIVNEGQGPFLTTDRNFRDFELRLEYKTVALADSGIYLKATPQIQIWDTTKAGGKWDIGADKGSGGLWNNSKDAPGKDPLLLADKPFGQWNKLRIRQVGARTSVWLNDKLVVNNAIMENYWARELPLIVSGPVQLQTHGGEIRWRNIEICEFTPQQANQILAQQDDEGFRSMFNGRDFDGWKGPVENYEVVDGNIRCKQHKGGTIYHEETLDDFVIRLEFKLPLKGNNGLAIRYPGTGDTAYAGMCELQVLDSEHAAYKELDPRQYHGSAYGMVAAHRGYLRPAQQWNFQEVTVKGSSIRVELNGTVILDADLAQVKEFMGDRPHPGKDRSSGFFGLAGHSDPVEFRNIFFKRLQD